MSVRAQTWAWDQDTGGMKEKLVLVKLADHACNEGWCWPAHATIAEKCNMSVRSVGRAIEKLIEIKLISVKHRTDSRGHRTSNLYKLDLDGKNLSDNLSLRDEEKNTDNSNNNKDNELANTDDGDKSPSDNLSGRTPNSGQDDPQTSTGQPNCQSVNPQPSDCQSLTDSLTYKPSLNHHMNHHQNHQGDEEELIKNSVEGWEGLFSKLGFSREAITSDSSAKMIHEFLENGVQYKTFESAHQGILRTQPHNPPIYPHYCRNKTVLKHKENGSGHTSSSGPGEPRWKAAGYESEEAFEKFKQQQAMKEMEKNKKLAEERKHQQTRKAS